jgi:hypothetical protein
MPKIKVEKTTGKLLDLIQENYHWYYPKEEAGKFRMGLCVVHRILARRFHYNDPVYDKRVFREINEEYQREFSPGNDVQAYLFADKLLTRLDDLVSAKEITFRDLPGAFMLFALAKFYDVSLDRDMSRSQTASYGRHYGGTGETYPYNIKQGLKDIKAKHAALKEELAGSEYFTELKSKFGEVQEMEKTSFEHN